MIVGVVTYSLTMNHWHNEEGSEEEGSARIGLHIFIWLVSFPSVVIGSMASDYVDQESERRCTAIQSFRSDLLSQLTQITEALQPFGYVVSTQEKDGDSFEVVIEKSLEWRDDNGLPPADTEENQAMLTKVPVELIQLGCLSRDTPLDIWLFGGLMMCLQNASKTHAKKSRRCGMIAQVLVLICWIASLISWFAMPFLYGLLVAFVGFPSLYSFR